MKTLVIVFLFLQDQPKWVEKINESPLILGLIILAVVSLIAVIIKKQKKVIDPKTLIDEERKRLKELQLGRKTILGHTYIKNFVVNKKNSITLGHCIEYHPRKTIKNIGGWNQCIKTESPNKNNIKDEELSADQKVLNYLNDTWGPEVWVPFNGIESVMDIETWTHYDDRLFSKTEILIKIKSANSYLYENFIQNGFENDYTYPNFYLINNILIAKTITGFWTFTGKLDNITYKDGKRVKVYKKEKSSTENKDWVNKSPKKKQLLEFEESINAFLEKMNNPSIKSWYEIVQKRGEGQALMADASSTVKEDDYNYWAEGHLEEYLLRINSKDEDMRLDKEAFLLRIKVFSEIIDGLEVVIKKATDLELNITKEMASDYHAAVASKLGAEMALKEIN